MCDYKCEWVVVGCQMESHKDVCSKYHAPSFCDNHRTVYIALEKLWFASHEQTTSSSKFILRKIGFNKRRQKIPSVIFPFSISIFLLDRNFPLKISIKTQAQFKSFRCTMGKIRVLFIKNTLGK